MPSTTLEKILRMLKRLIPKSLFSAAQPAYHYSLALIGALRYGFPSRKLTVIGVTGTKGKSTTVELVNAILEAAGYTTAVAGTIRFKIAGDSRRNLSKMTMPGRFFLQGFLARAAKAGCTHAVIEMTSEGSKQFRYRFVYPDALIFTNLSPEHIESHGSYEKYVEAKLNIGRRVIRSGKSRRIIVANADDKEGTRFLGLGAPESLPYSLRDGVPYEAGENGISFVFDGLAMRSHLPGLFNLYNILGAAMLAKALGVGAETIARGIANVSEVPGRAQSIRLEEDDPLASRQDFRVIVDYAHTPDSLTAIYSAFPERKIGVLGSTGGGRDTWKRPAMGAIADEHCAEVILTDEDPYDEDPRKIIDDVAAGIKNKKPEIIMDRREAIRRALSLARPGDAIFITGKGTDPFIMGKNGARTPWSDADIAREELEKILQSRA